jgi:hypothetical protein
MLRLALKNIKENLLLAIICIFLICSFFKSEPQAQTNYCKFTPAIYIVHVGPSDEIISPFIICNQKPSIVEIKLIIENPTLLNELQIITIAKDDLTNTLKESKKYLLNTKQDLHINGGSYQITVINDDIEGKKILNGKDTFNLLNVIEKINGYKYADLQHELNEKRDGLRIYTRD